MSVLNTVDLPLLARPMMPSSMETLLNGYQPAFDGRNEERVAREHRGGYDRSINGDTPLLFAIGDVQTVDGAVS